MIYNDSRPVQTNQIKKANNQTNKQINTTNKNKQRNKQRNQTKESHLNFHPLTKQQTEKETKTENKQLKQLKKIIFCFQANFQLDCNPDGQDLERWNF